MATMATLASERGTPKGIVFVLCRDGGGNQVTFATNATIAIREDTPFGIGNRAWVERRVGLPRVMGGMWWWTTHPYPQ